MTIFPTLNSARELPVFQRMTLAYVLHSTEYSSSLSFPKRSVMIIERAGSNPIEHFYYFLSS